MTENEARRIVLAAYPAAYVSHASHTARQIRAADHAAPVGSAGRSMPLGGVAPTEAAAWVSAARGLQRRKGGAS